MKNFLRLVFALVFLFALIFVCIYLPNSFTQEQLKEALYYQKLDYKVVQCYKD